MDPAQPGLFGAGGFRSRTHVRISGGLLLAGDCWLLLLACGLAGWARVAFTDSHGFPKILRNICGLSHVFIVFHMDFHIFS